MFKEEDETCFLKIQSDGNLVCYKQTSDNVEAYWASNTDGKGEGPDFTLVLQNDGNLVIIDSNSKPTWATRLSELEEFVNGERPYAAPIRP